MNPGGLGSEPTYLHHGDHAVVADRVGADGEVTHRVPADDPVDGVPVWRVGLVGVDGRQVGHHDVHVVLWNFTGKLETTERVSEEAEGSPSVLHGETAEC